ncbi:hypothetical protein HDV05_003022, partial [Chytridiales sp. JEL 0842]
MNRVERLPDDHWQRLRPLVDALAIENPDRKRAAFNDFYKTAFGRHLSLCREEQAEEPKYALPKKPKPAETAGTTTTTTTADTSKQMKTVTIKHGSDALFQASQLTEDEKNRVKQYLDGLVEASAVLRFAGSRLANAVLLKRLLNVFPPDNPDDPYACCHPPIFGRTVGTLDSDKFRALLTCVMGRARRTQMESLLGFHTEIAAVWEDVKLLAQDMAKDHNNQQWMNMENRLVKGMRAYFEHALAVEGVALGKDVARKIVKTLV